LEPKWPAARAWNVVRQGSVEIVVNVVAPFAIYVYFDKTLGDVKALLASSLPPIAWSVIGFARTRKVDAVSLLVLSGIALSLVAFVGGGSVRFLQLRENLVTALIGLVFLGSALVGKPLIYQLARASMARQSPVKVREFEQLRTNAGFRHAMFLMTLVWGVGLLAQAALACALVFAMSIRSYLVVGPIVSYACLGALALWTFWYSKRRRRMRGRSV
jgi:intracellular septation protein A